MEKIRPELGYEERVDSATQRRKEDIVGREKSITMEKSKETGWGDWAELGML